METKKCTKCGVEKEATKENFYKHKGFKDGMNSKCKSCMKEYEKEHRRTADYREKNKKYQKEWRLKNREKHNLNERRWREKNIEKTRERRKNANDQLHNSVVKERIKRRTGIEYKYITDDLIETKRLLIFIKRELKKLENGES